MTWALEYTEHSPSSPDPVYYRVTAVFLRSPFRVDVLTRELRFDSKEQAERAVSFIRADRSEYVGSSDPRRKWRTYRVVRVGVPA